MLLESFLTTIPTPTERPKKVAELGFREGTRVELPFGDLPSISGITLDMHEEVVRDLFVIDGGGVRLRDKTLQLAIKTYYRKRPLINAVMHAPEFDYVTGKISLAGLMVPRLQLAFLHQALTVSVDGEGVFKLLDHAQNTDAEDTAGDPVLGVIRGKDTTSDNPNTRRFAIGDQIYQGIQDMQSLVYGPDVNLTAFETDPAELASGPQFANYFGGAADITDNATTDFPLDVVLPGLIGGLKLGVWINHTDPTQVNIDLVHPDGTTIRVYTGSKELMGTSGSGDFLGQGTGVDACYFLGGEDGLYDVAYPCVGIFRPDRSLNAFLDKPAAGTWKLRVIDGSAGETGTVNQFWLGFLLPPPALCRMDVSDKPDTDHLPDPTCTFHSGHGQDSARVFRVKPQGDLTRNDFTAKSRAGTKRRVSNPSKLDYGRYEGFEAGNPDDSLAVLQAFADNEIGAYGRPIPFLELAPKDDGGQADTLRFGEDFFLGAYVKAVGKKGEAAHEVTARVMKATLENVATDQGSAAVQTDLDVVPVGAAAADLGD